MAIRHYNSAVAGAGGGSSFPESSVSVSRLAVQSIQTALADKVEYNVVNKDSLSEWDNVNFRFQPVNSGTYNITASLSSNAGWSAEEKGFLELHLNGALLLYLDSDNVEITETSYQQHLHGSVPIDLTSSDFIEIFMFHERGIPLDLVASGQYNYLNIQRIY